MKTSTAIIIIIGISLLLPLLVHGDYDDCSSDSGDDKKKTTLPLKLIALFSILLAGGLGVCLPVLGKTVRFFSPTGDIFFIIKAFAAGVILATGFVHIFPDAYENLTSPCIGDRPWKGFPFAGFIAMVAAIGTLMIDTFATGYYTRMHFDRDREGVHEEDRNGPSKLDLDRNEVHDGHVHLHTHATHGHAHGMDEFQDSSASSLLRHRVISQVLELGIVVHSVIIGISLGASQSASTIRPLVGALTFHQLFEGIGLGGCIVQAKFKLKSVAVMVMFFALTTPVGIAIGIGISSVYKENSSTALIVEGVLNSAAAGILIYMALVDLLAADFMNPHVQKKTKLQLGVNASLLVGAGLMSLLAKWA